MIVEFSVSNFRSINEIQTLSFSTSGLKSKEEFSFIDENNITENHGQKCFNVLGLYGANASGKSNIVKALDYFIKTISAQPSSVSNLSSLCQPFLFQNKIEETESFFQMIFILNDTKYRYGFTTKKNIEKKQEGSIYSNEIITNEWLYSDKVKNMSALFIREDNRISKNALQNKNNIPSSIPYRHNLYLAHAAAFDLTGDCKTISDYFRSFAVSDFEFSNEKFRWISIESLSNETSLKQDFIKLLASFNLGYLDIVLDEHSSNNQNEVFPQEKIHLVKSFLTEGKLTEIKLNLKHNESSGTQKMFDLAGLLLRVFNNENQCFILLDEIDSHFHPSLLISLVNLFNNPEINKSKSQLLFTSHDTNLMSPSIMRRDQFYFTEKTNENSTRLYSLGDLKGIRNDADFAKQYLAGYYGALPHLENYCSTENDALNG
ncbi:ATP-binding protein [Flavobacterium psychrophilum]|nr:ATP-binding protein [Flavobacterium psychrophilum]